MRPFNLHSFFRQIKTKWQTFWEKSMFLRFILIYFIVCSLLFVYILVHVSFSYLDERGATTSISTGTDVLAVLFIAISAALIHGPRRNVTNLLLKFLLIILSLSIIVFFTISGAALSFVEFPLSSIRHSRFLQAMNGSWITPHVIAVKEDPVFTELFVSSNFNPAGLFYSVVMAANTFRELCWYWVVVPFIDVRYRSPGLQYVILLLLVLGLSVFTVSSSLAVIASQLLDESKYILEKTKLPQRFFQSIMYAFKQTGLKWIRPHISWLKRSLVFLGAILFLAYVFGLFSTTPNRQIRWKTIEIQNFPSSDFPTITALELGPDNSTLIAGTYGHGILKSTDQGNTWFFSNRSFIGNIVQKIIVNQPQHLVFCTTNNGLFRSHDNGQSWTAIASGLPNNSSIIDLIIGPNGEDLFVTLSATSGGKSVAQTFRSEDYGESWIMVSDESSSAVPSYFTAINDGKTIYAASSAIGGGEPYISKDNGNSWEPLGLPTGVVFYEFFHISLDNRSLIFANSYTKDPSASSGRLGSIFLLNSNGTNHQPLDLGPKNGQLQTITVMPDKRTILAVVGNQLYRSDDGIEWIHIEQLHGLPLDWIRSLVTEPKTGDLIAATYSSGIYQSSDAGINWTETNNGIQFKSIGKIMATHGTLFVETSTRALFFSKDNGTSWQPLPHPPGVGSIKSINTDSNGRNQIIVSDYDNNIFWLALVGSELEIQRQIRLEEWSVDDQVFLPEIGVAVLLSQKSGSEPAEILQLDMNTGRSLSRYTVPFPEETTPAKVNRIFRIGSNLYLAGSGVYRPFPELPLYLSTDLGKTWQILSTVNFLSFDSLIQSNTGHRMLAIARFTNESVSQIVYSDDQGVTWKPGNHEMDGIEFTQLAVGPDNRSVLASSTNRGMFISLDNGLSWAESNQGLAPYENIRSFTVDHTNKTVFIGTARGVFRSTDSGRGWQAVDNGILDMSIRAIMEDDDGTLYAASNRYVASSKDNGLTWRKIGTLPPFGAIDIALIPDSDFLAAKRSSSGGSEIYFFDKRKEIWLDPSRVTNTDRVCSYDCELTLGPDGESLWVINDDRNIYYFDTTDFAWNHIGGVPTEEGGFNYVYSIFADPIRERLIINDSRGIYQLGIQSDSSSVFIRDPLPKEYDSNELSKSLYSSEIFVLASNGKIAIGRPGSGWLPFGNHEDYPPMALSIHGNKLIMYSTPGANILLYAEEPLPLIWSAPSPYISLVSSTWHVLNVLTVNPVSYLIGAPLLFVGLFSVILIKANYQRFKRRFEASNPIERLIVLSSPINSEWDFEQLIDRLRSQAVIPERNHIRKALTELSKRDLIVNRQSSFKITEPIITTIYQAISPENTLDLLVEQVRHEHPLVVATEQFLKRAGFHSFTPSGYGTLCSSDLSIWRDISPLYIHIAAENELTLNEFTEVMRAVEIAFQGDSRGHTVLIVLDQPPRASDLFQIFAQRAQRGFNIVPISSSLINLAQVENSEIQRLREQIDTYVGRTDLYDVRSSVSDVLSFFGRSSTLADIQKQLTSGRSAVVFGVRKIGKSSLMNRIKEESNWLVAFLDLEGYSGGLKYCYDDILQRWSNAHRARFPDASILPNTINIANLKSSERIRVLRTFIEKLFASLATKSEPVGLLLFLDEMDTLLEQPEYLEFASTFRSLAEDPRWQGRFAILAAGLDPVINRLDRLHNGRNPFFQFFSEAPIGPLKNEDIKTLIISIGGQMGFAFESEFLNLIAYASGGHPFIARQLCSQAIRNLERPSRVLVHQADLAIESYLATGRSYLSESLWSVDIGGPPSQEALLLKALAKTDLQTEGQLISSKLTYKKRRLLQLALDRLVDMSLIKQIELRWTITIPIYRSWIRQIILGLPKEE